MKWRSSRPASTTSIPARLAYRTITDAAPTTVELLTPITAPHPLIAVLVDAVRMTMRRPQP